MIPSAITATIPLAIAIILAGGLLIRFFLRRHARSRAIARRLAASRTQSLPPLQWPTDRRPAQGAGTVQHVVGNVTHPKTLNQGIRNLKMLSAALASALPMERKAS